jgi:hypothetical protein
MKMQYYTQLKLNLPYNQLMSEEVIPEEAFLNAIQYPTIIVDKGKVVRFNTLAEQTFKLSSAPGKGIVEIWPDYHFRETTSIEEIIFPEDTIRKYAVVKTHHLFRELVLGQPVGEGLECHGQPLER